MKKGLFDEERIDDLEDVSLEELLKEKNKEERKEKTKQTVKKISNQSIDISKKVALTIKEKAEDMYENSKERKEYKKANNIPTTEDYSGKFFDQYGIQATLAKSQMNRNLKDVLAEESEEKGYTITTALKSLLFEIFGFKGYVYYYMPVIVLFFLMLFYLKSLLIALPIIYLIYQYIKTHILYKKNAIFFDFYWYLEMCELDESYQGKDAGYTYRDIPTFLYNLDNEIEDYLEKRGRKMGTSQREYASISNSRIEKDERYGYVRVFEISNLFFRKPLDENSLESVELNDYFLIPQANNNSDFSKGVYFQVHGEVRQSIEAVMRTIERDEFIEKVVTDETINYAFPQIAQKLEEEAEAEKQRQRAEAERLESEKMYAAFEQKGLNDKAIKIIMKLKKNQENWGISVRDLFGRSMEFTKNYLKVRADLVDGTTIKQVDAQRIGSKVGITPQILKAENASAIYLMFILNNNIKGHKVTVADIKNEANQGFLTIGEGILGPVKIKFPRSDSPAFGLIGGLSRSGKSTLGTMIFSAMSYLNDGQGNYDYSDFFIASVKDEDYIANGFKKSGMAVVSDVFEIYNMLKLVDEIATKRKDQFLEKNTINIAQYNEVSEEKMGKIMVILDEYANTLTKASNFKVKTDAGSVTLDKAIEALAVKISQEHGSRGVSLFGLTQQFSKSAVGDLADVLGSRFLGYAKENVWQSQDPSKKVSAYLKNMEDTTEARRGRFFISAPDFAFTEDTRVQKIGSEWTEVKTNFAETSEYLKNFDRTFNTAEKYMSSITSKNHEDNENPTTYQSNLADDDI